MIPPTFTLASQKETNWTSDIPNPQVKFDCAYIEKVQVNDTTLSDKEMRELCGSKGYVLSLADGENTYIFVAENGRGTNTTVELKLSFDKNAYEIRKAQEEKDAKEKAEAEAKAKAEAEAKAKAEEEAKLNKYATDYCANRKTTTRKFSPVTVANNVVTHEFTKGKAGKYLSSSDCRNIINGIVSYMETKEGGIDSKNMDTIIAGKYYMDMNEHYFYVSIGDPNDINTSEYGSYTQNQVVYYKDAYGISAEYFYFDDGVLTSHQDF